jgi:hypothetical protein
MKRFFSVLVLTFLMVSFLTAAAPVPVPTFTWETGLPATMNVGDEAVVTIHVESLDQEFISVTAVPSFKYAGKGVVAVQGGDRAGHGTDATLTLTFEAKSTTERMENNQAVIRVVAGVRYAGGYLVTDERIYYVTIP